MQGCAPAEEQCAIPLTRAGGPRAEAGGGPVGDDDLARVRGLLRIRSGRGGRTEDDELAGRLTDEEEVDLAGVDADGHLQVEPTHRRRHGCRLPQGDPHLHCRVAGALGMALAAEHQQQGVAAELEQVGTAVEGQVQHPAEDTVEGLDDLLGTDAAALRQLLGQGREPGDVREHQRALDDPPRLPGRLVVPGQGHTRDVTTKVVHQGSSLPSARSVLPRRSQPTKSAICHTIGASRPRRSEWVAVKATSDARSHATDLPRSAGLAARLQPRRGPLRRELDMHRRVDSRRVTRRP